MKKLIFLLLIATLLCSAGCSKKSSDSESVNRLPATESQSEETTQSSTYKIPENLVYTVNGYPVIQTPPGWPQRDISNEDLIEEMKENVLFYIATELKLKIWPTEHVNYVGNHGGSASDSMYYWQYPGKAQR